MSVYAAQFVHDLNGDGCPEILAVHGGDELSDPGKAMICTAKVFFFLTFFKNTKHSSKYLPLRLV
jgi:hypothetical protein